MTIAEYLVVAMLAWAVNAPGERARFLSIAEDIAAVALDPEEAPLFSGARGRERTALLLAAVGSLESSNFRRDVDDGRVRGKQGEVCVLQVLLPNEHARIVMRGDTYAYSATEGWSYADLIADRRKCVRAALRKMRESFRGCHDLSLYTAGPPCNPDEPKAKNRLLRAEAWWRRHPFVAD